MDLKSELESLSNPEKARVLARFFKTGPGEYGEGDVFLGIPVPETRKIIKQFIDLSFEKLEKHLESEMHEERLASLLILVEKYNKSDKKGKKEIYDFYLRNTEKINSWDLVDSSADKIIGNFLISKDKSILYKLATSKNIWERRIAIISTFAFIKRGQFDDTFKISEILLSDSHDLIHKAVGWMLREAGKRNLHEEEIFLKKHYKNMPRTMLRYAIEKFPEDKRKSYLSGEI